MLGWIRRWMSGEAEIDKLLKKAEETADLDKKAAIYGELAEEGVRPALESLAHLAYDNKEWTAHNATKILNWLRAGTKKEIAWCQLVMGWMYENGLGASEDLDEAIFRYEQAARMDLDEGFFRLGLLTLRGEDQKKDPGRAGLYFYRASELGHEESKKYLAELISKGIIDESEISENAEHILDHTWGEPHTPWREAEPEIEPFELTENGEELWDLAKLTELAESGDAYAKCRLGILHLIGEELPKDEAKAAQYFEAASEAGLPAAQTNLAALYVTGQGVDLNYEKAMDLLRSAANSGDAFAMRKIGDLYMYGLGVEEDEALAAQWYEKAAEGDDGRAYVLLGQLYLQGNGVTEDRVKAQELFLRGAELGEVEGCYLYARTLLDQEDPEKIAEGVSMLEKAVEFGFPPALALYAHCYEVGHGVEANEGEAIRWYFEASQRGAQEATIWLGRAILTGKLVAPGNLEKANWLQAVADTGEIAAYAPLADLYMIGQGVRLDEERAFSYYKKAAQRGDAESQFKLFSLYKQGKGARKNEEKARYWLEEAAKQGHGDACFRLGTDLLAEEKVEEAIAHLLRAADKDHPLVASLLGDIYSKQIGGLEKAKYWYEKALEGGDFQMVDRLRLLEACEKAQPLKE